MRNLVLSCSLGLLAACGSVPNKEFEFRAIGVDGQRVPCLVVIDGQWPTGDEPKHYTDCRISVPFPHAEVRVLVKPAQLNAEGKVIKPPAELDPEPYKTDARDIRIGDPRIQLFILERDTTYSG